jgi:hypothetical protein
MMERMRVWMFTPPAGGVNIHTRIRSIMEHASTHGMVITRVCSAGGAVVRPPPRRCAQAVPATSDETKATETTVRSLRFIPYLPFWVVRLESHPGAKRPDEQTVPPPLRAYQPAGAKCRFDGETVAIIHSPR